MTGSANYALNRYNQLWKIQTILIVLNKPTLPQFAGITRPLNDSNGNTEFNPTAINTKGTNTDSQIEAHTYNCKIIVTDSIQEKSLQLV